jgi:hypothetical protein
VAGWPGIPVPGVMANLAVLAIKIAPCPFPEPLSVKIPGVAYRICDAIGEDVPVSLSTVSDTEVPGDNCGHWKFTTLSAA